jgi:hypothetical protein
VLGLEKPTLSGPSTVCNQATFTINNLPQGATVNWSHSMNLAPVSIGSDSIVLRAFKPNGFGTVSATVTSSSLSINLPALNVWVGKPNQPTDITFLPASPCLNQEVIAMVTANNPAQSNAYYQWSGISNILYTNGNASEIFFKTMTELPYTTYVTVKACNDCGCSLPYTKLLSVNDCGGGNPPAPVAIYPNPATDRLTIELTADETENTDMLLHTTSTTVVESYIIQLWHERNGMVREIKSTERVTHISLPGLPKGMYFVHVKKEGEVVQKQILWVR